MKKNDKFNTMKNVNLRPLWDALLDVYEVFSDICERHGLRYCADAGTALGAVRHGGFIPWDDDIDIQMPRPDYERFVEIVKMELPPGLAWLDRNTCSLYDKAFGKIIVTDSVVLQRVAKAANLLLGEGIFIDIFPLDGYPDGCMERIWRVIQNHLVCFRVKFNMGWRGNPTLKGKIAFVLGGCLLPFNYKIQTERDRVEFYEQRAKRYPFGSTKKCVSIGIAQYSDDKPYEFSFFGTPRKIPFDRAEMFIQENVSGYLTAKFGDYKRLPPVEQRVLKHACVEIVPWRLGPVEEGVK